MPAPTNHLKNQAEALNAVVSQLTAFHQALTDMRATQEKMADAIGKLAVIEERQSTTSGAVNRSFKAIERLEDHDKQMEIRLRSLETANVANSKVSKWVDSALIGSFVMLAAYIAKSAGLI